MSYSSQVPQRLRTYFGADVTRDDFPIVVDAFAQGTGWKSYPIKKKVTVSWCRKMRREGFEKIGVRCNGHTADFSLVEIIKGETKAKKNYTTGEGLTRDELLDGIRSQLQPKLDVTAELRSIAADSTDPATVVRLLALYDRMTKEA